MSRNSDDHRVERAVIIIGVAKAATTSLYEHLSTSGAFSLPALKETRYFLSADHPLARSANAARDPDPIAGYLGQFEIVSGRPLLEATPDYYADPTARSRVIDLAEAIGPVTLVCLLRDPVARLRSLFLFARDTMTVVPRDRTLDDYALDLLDGREAKWQSNPMLRRGLTDGLYAQHLGPWSEAFGRQLVLFPSELLSDHLGVLTSAMATRTEATVPQTSDARQLPRRNQTLQPRVRALHVGARRLARALPPTSRSRALVRRVYDRWNGAGKDRPAERWSPDVQHRLEDFYAPDKVTLARLLDAHAPSELPSVGWM